MYGCTLWQPSGIGFTCAIATLLSQAILLSAHPPRLVKIGTPDFVPPDFILTPAAARDSGARSPPPGRRSASSLQFDGSHDSNALGHSSRTPPPCGPSPPARCHAPAPACVESAAHGERSSVTRLSAHGKAAPRASGSSRSSPSRNARAPAHRIGPARPPCASPQDAPIGIAQRRLRCRTASSRAEPLVQTSGQDLEHRARRPRGQHTLPHPRRLRAPQVPHIERSALQLRHRQAEEGKCPARRKLHAHHALLLIAIDGE